MVILKIGHFDRIVLLWCWLWFGQILSICSGDSVVSNNNSEGDRSFVWLSDIHFDPLFGGEESGGGGHCRNLDVLDPSQIIPPLGCECNLQLMKEVLSHASKSTTTKPSMVIVSGDLCRHSMDRIQQDPYGVFLDIMTTVSKAVRDFFAPDIPILFTIGNNDIYPDYKLDLKVLNDVETRLQTSFGPNTLAAFGYVDYDVFHDLTILSLNTNMFSNRLVMDQDAAQVFDPESQWAWVESQLKRCRTLSRNVWILGHIPPTVQSYSKGEPLWKDEHVDRYRHLLETYNDVIQTQMFGHLHTNEFRLFSPRAANFNPKLPPYISGIAPLWITPAVTPIFNNYPIYHTVTYNLNNPNGFIDIYPHVYNVKDSTWLNTPSFREAYGNLPDLSAQTVHKYIIEPVLTSSDNGKGAAIFRTFMTRFKYNPPSDLCDTLLCRVPWGCTWISNTEKEYTTCLNNYMPKTSKSSRVAAAVLMAFMLSLLVGMVIFAIRQKLIDDERGRKNAKAAEDGLWSSNLDEDETDYNSISKNDNEESNNNKALPDIT